jgi:O-antigen ligase
MLRLFTGISEDASARSRTDSYALAFEFVGQHPVFGRGLSTFLPRYRILDNQYLGLLIEAGIVGLVAFLALLVTALVVALRLSRTLPDPSDRGLARSLMATIACAALSCLTFDVFGFPQVSGMLFFAIGAIGVLIRVGGLPQMELGSDNVRLDLESSATAPTVSGFSLSGLTGGRR